MGALSSAQQIMVRLYLLGGPQYRAEMEKAGLVTKDLAAANTLLGRAMERTNKRSFLQNQLLFTARRGLFYTTLATAGLAAEVVKMGFAYDNAMESAQVALEGVIKPTGVLSHELQQLFQIAAGTPFQVKDVTLAFRQMFISFKPFHVSLKTINDTILAITDNLSATGKVTPAALSRVSIALSHMANIGHLTGSAVQQLAKDGLQLQPALRKELHLSTEQLQNLGKAGIPARDVLMAIIKYSKSAAGISGQAFAQANKTLTGSFSSLKDYVAQAAGGALGGPGGQKGIFGGLQQRIMGINKQLSNMAAAGKTIHLSDIANAIDRQLSPKTHLIINLFVMLNSAIHTLVFTLGLLFKAVGIILWPFTTLLGLFGGGTKGAKLMGIAVGLLSAIVLIGAARWLAYRAAVELAEIAFWGLGKAIGKTITLEKTMTAVREAGGIKGVLTGGIGKWRNWTYAQTGGKALPTRPAGMEQGVWERMMGGGAAAEGGAFAKLSRKIFDAAPIKRFGTALRTTFAMFKDAGLKGSLKIIAANIVRVGIAMWALVPAIWAGVVASWQFFAANLWWSIFVLAIIAVIVAVVLLYRKWQWFHDLVVNSARFIRKYWIYFTLFLGLAVFAISEVVKHWGFFENILNRVVDALKRVIHYIKSIPGRIPGLSAALRIAGRIGGWFTSKSTHATPKQHGGPIFGSGGLQLVGEAGPELVSLPGGSNVIPNNRLHQVNPVNFNGGRDGNDKPIVVQVMLDRKVLAQGVARANQDYAARR